MSEQSTPRNTEAAAPVHDVAVLGGGSFGTAMAKVLGENGHRVHFWMRGKAQAEEIRSTRINSRYMPGIELTGDIQPTTDLADAVSKAEIVFVAIPSKAFRAVIRENSDKFRDEQIVISLTKGIEEHGCRTFSRSEMAYNLLGLLHPGMEGVSERGPSKVN